MRLGTSKAEDPGEDLHRRSVTPDQLIDAKGSRSESSSAEDPGELLHQQTDEGDSERPQLRIQEKICIGGASR